MVTDWHGSCWLFRIRREYHVVGFLWFIVICKNRVLIRNWSSMLTGNWDPMSSVHFFGWSNSRWMTWVTWFCSWPCIARIKVNMRCLFQNLDFLITQFSCVCIRRVASTLICTTPNTHLVTFWSHCNILLC